MTTGVQRLLIALALSAIILIPTYPLILNLNTSLPTINTYSTHLQNNDPAMFCWNLWWVNNWLSGQHPLMACHMLHHPFGISLHHHTLSLANGILASPVTASTNPVTAHNLLLILHTIITTLATFLLARLLGIKPLYAVISTLIFTWWPARLIHASFHLNLASTGWLVLALITTLKSCQSKNWLWIILTGILIAVTGASSWHLLICLILLIPLFLHLPPTTKPDSTVSTTSPTPTHPSPTATSPASGPLSVVSLTRRYTHSFISMALGLILLLPLLLPLLHHNVDIPVRSITEKENYSIPPVNHFISPVTHGLWGQALHSFYKTGPGNVIENTGTLGISILILAVLGGYRPSRRQRWLLGGTGLLILLSWGPTLKLFNWRIPLPYRLFDLLPGISNSRTPGRFLIPAGLLLGLLCAMELQKLMRTRSSWAWFSMGLIFLELLPGGVDTIDVSRAMQAIENQREQFQQCETGMLVVPNDWTNRQLLLEQTIHCRPITTGFTARLPQTVFQRIRGIPMMSQLSRSNAAFNPRHLDDDSLKRIQLLLNVDSVYDSARCAFYRCHPIEDISLAKPEIYLLDRWSGPENWGTGFESVYWGLWPEARLRLIGMQGTGTVTVQCQLLAAQQADNEPVQCSFFHNGMVAHSLQLKADQGWQSVHFALPITDSPLPYQDITVVFSTGTAPCDLPDASSSDPRKLAVAMAGLRCQGDAL